MEELKELRRRVGKFTIDRYAFLDISVDKFKELTEVMSNFLIIRADPLSYMERVEYVAVSPLFDEVKEGDRIPEYEVIVTRYSPEEHIRVEVKRL